MSDELSATAMEYALGTLSHEERIAFARRLEADSGARAALADWEGKLAPMAAAIPPVEPDASIWRAIEQKLGPSEAAVGSEDAVSNVVPLQRAVRRWRFAAGTATALAACLALYVGVRAPVQIDRPVQTAAVQALPSSTPSPSPSPVSHTATTQAQANEAGQIATASASRQNENLVVTANGPREGEVRGGLNVQPARETEAAIAYVGALAPPASPAALIVRTDAGARTLTVRRLAAAAPSGSVMRLWLIAANAPPRALGIVSEETTRLALPRDVPLAGAAIAASIDPAGAAHDAPVGPFVFEGRLVRD